ncbi:hypothetical protein E0M27_14130 [Bacillus mycoides]|nr:hypothetical protein E0M27_14130 [Bacillus mycoides]
MREVLRREELAAGAGYQLKAEPTAQDRWLRFFLTEDAFYLLVGKVLRLKGLGGEASHWNWIYPLKAQGARSLPSPKHTPPAESGGFFIVILRFSPLMPGISLF